LGFAIAILSALALFFIGESSPIVLLLCFVPFAVVNTYYRPMISDMLLSTLKSNVGAAASVMNFSCTVIGGIGMKKAIFFIPITYPFNTSYIFRP
jgi:DHA1 family bicyclomycin/chloramphenicol resistance-like MFS transporter